MTESTSDRAEPARRFESYTSADHARVALAERAWTTLDAVNAALVPEGRLPNGTLPTALIRAALDVQHLAEKLVQAAVVASHERGLSWTQIGQGLGVSKQAAHERFAGDVTKFRQALVDHLDALAANPDADVERPGTHLVDTAWYAPKLDAWRAELGRLPGGLSPAGRAGELLAQLSDADTAVTGLNGINARHPDSPSPRCRFTAELDWDAESEPGDYFACTEAEGHPGKHKLAVANSYD
jgi:hypothetical protein